MILPPLTLATSPLEVKLFLLPMLMQLDLLMELVVASMFWSLLWMELVVVASMFWSGPWTLKTMSVFLHGQVHLQWNSKPKRCGDYASRAMAWTGDLHAVWLRCQRLAQLVQIATPLIII